MVSKKLRVNYVVTDDVESTSATTDNGSGVGAAGVGAGAGAGAAGAAGIANLGAPNSHSSQSNNVNSLTPERPNDKSINDSYSTPSNLNNDASEASGIVAASKIDKSQDSDDLQKELDASNAEINNLSNKLDSNQFNEKKNSNQSNTSTTDEPVNGFSLPFALFLVLLAFILGWLIF